MILPSGPGAAAEYNGGKTRLPQMVPVGNYIDLLDDWCL